jgi:hypothetical protein
MGSHRDAHGFDARLSEPDFCSWLRSAMLNPSQAMDPIDHDRTGWHGELRHRFPLHQAQTLHDRSLAHIRGKGWTIVGHFPFALRKLLRD